MVKIKAAIAFKGDVDKLIEASVEKFEVALPEKKFRCYDCNQKGTLKVSTAEAGFKSGAVVKNIPAWRCKCGTVYHDMDLLVAIEEIIGNSSKEIDFQDLQT